MFGGGGGSVGAGLPVPGTTPGANQLDGPPPSMTQSLGQGNGNPMPPMGAMAPPIASAQLPPEMLSGMQSAADAMVQTLNSFAQATPDLAQDWAAVLTALQSAMSKLQLAGAGPTSPTSTGPGFPGGGIDQNGPPRLPQQG